MTTPLGIDPGAKGALVALVDGSPIVLEMPWIPRAGVSLPEVRRWLEELPRPIVVAMESLVSPGPHIKGSKSGMQSKGRNHGVLEGLLVGLGIRYDTIHPKRWQKEVCPGSAPTKSRSVAACERLFPGIELRVGPTGRKRRPHDGIADAACLAEYARRVLA